MTETCGTVPAKRPIKYAMVSYDVIREGDLEVLGWKFAHLLDAPSEELAKQEAEKSVYDLNTKNKMLDNLFKSAITSTRVLLYVVPVSELENLAHKEGVSLPNFYMDYL